MRRFRLILVAAWLLLPAAVCLARVGLEVDDAGPATREMVALFDFARGVLKERLANSRDPARAKLLSGLVEKANALYRLGRLELRMAKEPDVAAMVERAGEGRYRFLFGGDFRSRFFAYPDYGLAVLVHEFQHLADFTEREWEAGTRGTLEARAYAAELTYHAVAGAVSPPDELVLAGIRLLPAAPDGPEWRDYVDDRSDWSHAMGDRFAVYRASRFSRLSSGESVTPFGGFLSVEVTNAEGALDSLERALAGATAARAQARKYLLTATTYCRLGTELSGDALRRLPRVPSSPEMVEIVTRWSRRHAAVLARTKTIAERAMRRFLPDGDRLERIHTADGRELERKFLGLAATPARRTASPR